MQKRYGCEAEVIHPPVDCARFTPRQLPAPDGYYAMVTAFAPYKRDRPRDRSLHPDWARGC